MSDLNKKNINYGALNRFYQDLKNHDISPLNDRIDNIAAEFVAGSNITISGNTISANGYRYNTTNGAFAEGDRDINDGGTIRVPSTATGVLSHAEGYATTASGAYAHAEGQGCTASGRNSHAEGEFCDAYGIASHAEGYGTDAYGMATHAEGYSTNARNPNEHAEGIFNISHEGNAGKTLHSIGIGTADNARKNAVEVMQNGDMYLLGVGGYDGIHIKDETGAPSGLQTLQEYIASLETRIYNLEHPNS